MKNGQAQESRSTQRRSVQCPTHEDGEEGFTPRRRKTKADYRAEIQPASPPVQLFIQREVDAAVAGGAARPTPPPRLHATADAYRLAASYPGAAELKCQAVRLRREQAPAGQNRWPVCSADENIIVQIPDRCLTAAGIVKQVVRMAVPIKIRYSH